MSASPLKPSPSQDALLGQQVGNLRVVERIGQGGFGTVYRAEHVLLGTPYAIKVLRGHVQSSDDAIERFRREANTIAQLEHPHVIRVTDFGALSDGGQYLAMEYLSGQSLKDAIREGRPLSLDEIQRWMAEILETLQYIHSLGITHRDIKPGNLFLHRTRPHHPETIKILDFGIAAMANGQSLTQSGETIGSPVYMSPEQARGLSKYVDGRADLYSLGVILYEVLAGRPPFRGENFTSTLLMQLQQPPPPLRDSCPHHAWAPSLENLLHRLLEKEPEQRYADATHLKTALMAALQEQSVLTPGALYPPPAPEGTMEMPAAVPGHTLSGRRGGGLSSVAEEEATVHTPIARRIGLSHTLDPAVPAAAATPPTEAALARVHPGEAQVESLSHTPPTRDWRVALTTPEFPSLSVLNMPHSVQPLSPAKAWGEPEGASLASPAPFSTLQDEPAHRATPEQTSGAGAPGFPGGSGASEGQGGGAGAREGHSRPDPLAAPLAALERRRTRAPGMARVVMGSLVLGLVVGLLVWLASGPSPSSRTSKQTRASSARLSGLPTPRRPSARTLALPPLPRAGQRAPVRRATPKRPLGKPTARGRSRREGSVRQRRRPVRVRPSRRVRPRKRRRSSQRLRRRRRTRKRRQWQRRRRSQRRRRPVPRRQNTDPFGGIEDPI